MNAVQTKPEACLPYLVTIPSGSDARKIARAIAKECSPIKLSPRVYLISRGCVGSPAALRSPDTVTVAERLAAQLPAATVNVCECDYYSRRTPATVRSGPNHA